MALLANKQRIYNSLEKLAQFNSFPEQKGITRMLFSEEELKAREYIKTLMEQAGLSVEEDAIGNIYGTLKGEQPDLPPVWSGSHIDTVRNGGAYDGTVGVIGAIEACRMIKESGLSHQRNIVALVFSSEEPTRFGVGCIGSRAMAGHLSLEETQNLVDENGISLYDELKRLGYTEKSYHTVTKKKGDVFASVELHIEQASELEENHLKVGIVEAICAPTYIHVLLEGKQGHAGSTPMNSRRDTMAAAAQIISELETLALSYGNPHTVATVGRVLAFPNSSNVIPGRTELFLDIRDSSQKRKSDLIRKICAYVDTVAMMRDLKSHCHILADDLPFQAHPKVIQAMEESCKQAGLPIHKMVSGAYHDSLMIAEFAPMGMIFVPSQGGISHDEAEYTDIEEIVLGTQVLAETLLSLSNQAV